MTSEWQLRSDQTAAMIRTFLASYDATRASDRQLAYRIRELLHREIYRRERKHFPEWIDQGGEG